MMSKDKIVNIDDINNLEIVEDKIRETHNKISANKTPSWAVKRRPDGFDYVEEGYMRNKLNDIYPVWSWEAVGSGIQFIGAEWAVVTAELVVVDNGVPRKFFSPGAARIQFKRGTPHTPENVVDIDKNIASANTNAFKRACNRLVNIADDVYKKHIEDLTLSPEQIEEVEEMIKDLDVKYQESVRLAIEDGILNSKNLNNAINKIMKEQSKNDDNG
tara:strand:+ start:126 stop:773 length:648 start_codon:yes stop_codon:yes gene_type:complete